MLPFYDAIVSNILEGATAPLSISHNKCALTGLRPWLSGRGCERQRVQPGRLVWYRRWLNLGFQLLEQLYRLFVSLLSHF